MVTGTGFKLAWERSYSRLKYLYKSIKICDCINQRKFTVNGNDCHVPHIDIACIFSAL